MNRFLCIHCHFYQPPRENPWLEFVELQESAYPYHDWNERITFECYAANSASRILDGSGRIARIVNNYERISFNFGPTLLSWMEINSPDVYEAILKADCASKEHFSGHGSAIAQAYNHLIMPLANRRDKETQVVWGIRDFERRFGRSPEGMWLPETAVDIESLEVLADHGIRYTILSPSQARQARRQGRPWRDVEGGHIDPKHPYYCELPSGNRIALFFYDGPISHAVAFEKLLSSGENFASRLMDGYTERPHPQLMHIATDGETYGHHHPHGDMALAYALSHIESNNLARITNYGEYLELHPPVHEVEIIENTSWSCAHGVERWKSNCGCNSGHAGWHQQWRQPLRNALDHLRDDIAAPFQEQAGKLVTDPWATRNDYIGVVLERSPENVDEFLRNHQKKELTEDEQTILLTMLEMQRHAMLMYTSCGWYFDDISGLEAVQVIQYAARAIQLAQQLFGDHREERLMEWLAFAPTNVSEFENGAEVYRKLVRTAMVDLLGVGAHYAISALFRGFERHGAIYAYEVRLLDSRTLRAGRMEFALGRANVCSRVTRCQAEVTFGVLHFGDNNVIAAVRNFRGDAEYQKLLEDAEQAFTKADIGESVHALDRHFERTAYSLKSLFKDERRRIVAMLLSSVVNEAETMYRQVYDSHASLMRFLADIQMPYPRVLSVTAELVVNSSLRRAFEDDALDVAHISSLLDTARRENLELDVSGLSYALTGRINSLMQSFAAMPEDVEILERMNAIFAVVQTLPFQLNLWKVQNLYYGLACILYPQLAAQNGQSGEWARQFCDLGRMLEISPEVIPEPKSEVAIA